MKNRKSNTQCKICQKNIYRRPYQIEKNENFYCSKECMIVDRKNKGIYKRKDIKCLTCQNNFYGKPKQIYCSKKCANKFRRKNGTKRIKGYKNIQDLRLSELRKVYDFKNCMVKDCTYCKTYDIHRLIPGKDGGEYKIGNMFAICPNHHAEVHRGFIKLIKISDYELMAEEIEYKGRGKY